MDGSERRPVIHFGKQTAPEALDEAAFQIVRDAYVAKHGQPSAETEAAWRRGIASRRAQESPPLGITDA